MIINIHIISILIWMPIISGLLIYILDNIKIFKKINKYFSIFISFFLFLLSILILIKFNIKNYNYQFIEKKNWINNLNINYYLGIDNISLFFILLVIFFNFINILITFDYIKYYINKYLGLSLILTGLMIGMFSSIDCILYYIFLEISIIPIFIIIGIWGGKNKIYATFKLFIYNILSSFLMLIGFLYLNKKSLNKFDILSFYKLNLLIKEKIIIFILFFLSFSIKIPLFPFHTWLTNAHVEAPTGGSIILSSIMLKYGIYNFLRFLLPIINNINKYYINCILIISLISIIYSGLVTLIQNDLKKIIAYSSINHMGILIIGIFLFNQISLNGILILTISHSLISCGLFLLIGVLYKKFNNKNIFYYNGLAKYMPKFSVFFVIFSLANCGLPLTSGFIGEFLIIINTIKYNFYIGLILCINIIISTIYSLWVIKCIIFGNKKKNIFFKKKDINNLEFFILSILIIIIFIIGIYPNIIINFINNK